nr:glycosyltransferase family 9 protein [Mesorhizobium sp.]
MGYDPPERPLRWLERQPANVPAKPFGFGERHYLYRYLSPLEALGVDLRVRVPSIRPLPLETARALALLDRHHLRRKAFIAVHAGASFQGRRWQPERFAAVVDEISRESGLDFVLVGGPDERKPAEQILARAASPVVDLVGALSLETLLAFLEQARLFLGNERPDAHGCGGRNSGCRAFRADQSNQLGPGGRTQCCPATVHAVRVRGGEPVPVAGPQQGLLRLASGRRTRRWRGARNPLQNGSGPGARTLIRWVWRSRRQIVAVNAFRLRAVPIFALMTALG